MNQNYAGQSFEDVRQRLHGELREIKQDMIRLLSQALEAGNKAVAEGHEQYVISGERNLLSVQELSQDVTRLKQLFELFERKSSLIQILDLSLRGQGVQIFIGGESGVSAPDEVSVRPWSVNDGPLRDLKCTFAAEAVPMMNIAIAPVTAAAMIVR